MTYSNQYKDVESIIDTLLILDTFCASRGIEVEFVVVGASGILLFIEMMNKDAEYRPTRDIDIRVTEGVVTPELKEANSGIRLKGCSRRLMCISPTLNF